MHIKEEISLERRHIEGTWEKNRAFSPAVVASGGTMVFVAGHGGFVDDSGKSLAGDFEAQTRQTFKNLEATLKQAGATLKDLVTMTVFISDSRHGTRFTEIRREVFQEKFPASALITCAGFARPEMMVEIQAIAVVS
jgi:enamine deaminase RidA (YjgF/YER057c/UK114 family)